VVPKVLACLSLAMLAACTSSNGAEPNRTPPTTVTSTTPTSTSPTPTTSAPTTSSSPTPTGPKTTGPGVSPGEKPPVMSKLAKDHTRGGAVLFASYYFNALDWSIATNDPTLLRPLAQASCKTCAGFVKSLEDLAANGNHTEGGRIQVGMVGPVDPRADFARDGYVEIHLDQAPGRIVSEGGQPVSILHAGKSSAIVALTWYGRGWSVTGISKS